MIQPRNILEESYENIEREINVHCEYLTSLKLSVSAIRPETQSKVEAMNGYQKLFQKMSIRCYQLLHELRQVKQENVELFLENERLLSENHN